MKKEDKEKISLHEYIKESATKKAKTVHQWFDDTVANIPQCRLATHIGKFSNPDVKISLLKEYEPRADGYVITQNSKCKADIVVPAQYIGAASLLLKEVNQLQNVLEVVSTKGTDVKDELKHLSLSEDTLQVVIRQVLAESHTEPDMTDTHLRQVYFPVDDNSYHLLSLLPASSLMLETKERVRRLNEDKRRCYDKENTEYGTDCCEITSLTVIGFGGTKPQNISALNSQQGGKAYLLFSLSPQLSKRVLVYPKKDYFREVVWYKEKEALFRSLDKLMKGDRNNLQVRQNIAEVTENLVDYVMNGVYTLRESEVGWSSDDRFVNLGICQKIWLDDLYKEERKNPEWIVTIGSSFARWVVYSYEKLLGDSKITLGDAEFQYFQDAMTHFLQKEVRYSL